MIPGINIAAKTGTAQNFRFIRGKKIELNENSMFVAFAPREDPRIAICVVVENAGYGSTSAAPIASLMIEKYLNDTLRPESVKKADELAQKDMMPSILEVEQFIADSMRAVEWFKITKDSSYLRKFQKKGQSTPPAKKDTPVPGQRVAVLLKPEMAEPEKQLLLKKKNGSV